MAHNTITCNGKTYTDKDIESATGYRKSPIIGDELPYDTFKAEIWDYDSNLTALPYGSPVTWTRNGKIVLAQFLSSVQRTGKYKYLLSCVSGIGLLAQIKHYGGMYENVLFSTILADIIGGTFPYTVDSGIASIAVYGWLPVDNCRGNLRRLLTATGAVVRANADGSARFAAPNTASPSQIKDQDIYMGGTVDYPTRYQAVKITEHAYSITQNDILTTLLDGEASGGSIVTPKGVNVTGALITFSDPMHDLSVEGSEILESGVNYAVLSPSGSCMLTGYKYSHTTRIVTAGSLENSEKATKRLDDCTLIGIFNSSIVAKRWLDFYSSQKIVKISTVWNGEQPSDAVTFLDPYDNQDIGLIESQDVRLSAKVAADIEVQVGIIPPVFEYRNSRKIYTSNGSITVPAGVTHIRAVLIGGAYGGKPGNPGETGGVGEKFTYTNSVSGKRTYWRTLGRGGKGGLGGEGGQAGKVLVVDIDVTPGDVESFVIGTGGAANSAGTATTFGAHSSADGSVLPDGYVDPVTGDVYATTGDVGLPGGDGNGWAGGDLNRTNALNIALGAPVGGYGPGENSLETASDPGYYVYYYIMSGGGARNQNGSIEGGSISTKLSECKGGKGADATYIPEDKPSVPGKGGTGGSGGGGGGGAAAQEMLSSTDATAQGGDGGLGSRGGPGANGALILYYAEPVAEPVTESYLTFSSPSSFTLKVNDATKHWDGTLEYSTDASTWSTWDGTTTLPSATSGSDNVLYLRGTGNSVITGNDQAYSWVLTGSDIACIGNIENLLDYATVKSGAHPTMTDYCYNSMFRDCTSLTQAPALPATTLANDCYAEMFYGCTSLTQAPALPATTLANNCYRYMFQNCTSLAQAPALPATTMTDHCYFYMFRNCTSLTKAPALPATTLAIHCYNSMFRDCTSLTQAPALPATTLANNCYAGMFYGCTSLTQAPALPATTMTDHCYFYMFRNCTSLKLSSTQTGEYMVAYRIPTTGTGTAATNALNNMFTGTGGTFTGTPEINTTYYLSNTNTIV